MFRPSLQKSEKELLIDEIEFLIENSPKGTLLRAIRVLYGDKLKRTQYDPVDLIILLVNGLKKNNFFTFCQYMKVFNG